MGTSKKQKTSGNAFLSFYINNDLPIIILEGKRPIEKAWSEIKPRTLSQLEKAFKKFSNRFPHGFEQHINFGMVIRDDIMIMDVDPRNYDKGIDSLEAFSDAMGYDFLSEGLVIRTGGGGYHIYFKKDPKVRYPDETFEYRGLEFKQSGFQVVIPGSLHPDTKNPYEVLHGSLELLEDLPILPETVHNYLQRGAKTVREQREAAPPPPIEVVEDIVKDHEQAIDKDISAVVKRLTAAVPNTDGAGQGNNALYRAAAHLKKEGLPVHLATQVIRQWDQDNFNSRDDKELQATIDSAYNREDIGFAVVHPRSDFLEPVDADSLPKIDGTDLPLELMKGGLVKRSMHNLHVVLQQGFDGEVYQCLGYDEMTGATRIISTPPWASKHWQLNADFGSYPRPVSLEDITALRVMCERGHGLSMSKEDIKDTVKLLASRRPYNPLQEYLTKLEWDGEKRLDDWMIKHLGTPDNAYYRDVGRMLFMAGISRAFHPGCKFDYMLVVEGPQGSGKSTFVRILSRGYFSDNTQDLKTKDAAIATRGVWFQEVAEMDAYNKADSSTIKKFITSQQDEWRKLYSEDMVKVKRLTIFIGTINPEGGVGYLKDTTGNRRFLPIESGEINLDWLTDNMDQLWAEAMHDAEPFFQAGGLPKLVLDGAAQKYALRLQTLRQEQDPYTVYISDWLEQAKKEKSKILDQLSGEAIASEALGIQAGNVHSGTTRRISAIMQKLGYVKRQANNLEGRPYLYVKKKTT